MTPTLPGLAHHHARISGTELHYVEMGTGPLVLLLHGFPEFWWSWRHIIPALAQSYRVVAVDMRGYHLSAKPATGYDLATLATDTAQLIDHLGGPALVAGHDWGGIVAYQTAMDHPQAITRLAILNAPHPDAWIASWLSDPEQQRNADGNRQYREQQAGTAVPQAVPGEFEQDHAWFTSFSSRTRGKCLAIRASWLTNRMVLCWASAS